MFTDEVEKGEEQEEILDVFRGGNKLLVYGIYTQLLQEKEFFGNLGRKYRALASTWLIAAFAGMGFLVSGHLNIELPFNFFIGIIILSFCTASGVTLLWFLDVVLYYTLTKAVLVELARLEKKHPWLGHVHWHLLLIRETPKYRVYQSSFYIGINGLFISISAIVSLFYFSSEKFLWAPIILGAILLYWLVSHYMIKFSGEKEQISLKGFEKKRVRR
jgi:hypothetical protein